MAMSGGACSAYKCQVQEYKLIRTPTTALRSECARVDDAWEKLERGEEVVVAGSDIERLRQRLAAFGVA